MAQVLIAADAFTGNVSHEDRYFFGINPPYHTPVLMSAGHQTGLSYGSPIYGPFPFGNALYCLLMPPSGALAISVSLFQSVDNGATWTELDAANRPSNGVNSASCAVLNGSTLIVAYLSGAGPAEVRFKNFDLVAGVWGATYGSGAGVPVNATNVSAAYARPDGTLAVVYQITPNPVAPASNMWIGVYSQPSPGGAWVTTVDVGVNLVADASYGVGDSILVIQSCSTMDSTGRIHLFPCDNQSAVEAYQLFKSDNTLGTYKNFKAVDNLQVNSGAPIGHPVVIGSNLVVPVSVRVLWPSGNSKQMATVYVGTPLSAPVFTLLGVPGIDPDDADWIAFQENSNTPSNVPYLFSDGTTLYAVWPRLDSDGTGNQFSQLRLGQTTNLANPSLGWTDSTIFDLAVDSPPGFNFVGQKIQNPSVYAAASSNVTPVPVTTGGGPYVIPKPCLCDVDELALEELARVRTRQRQFPYVHRFPPPGAIPVRVQNSILVPTVAAGETQGLLFTVDEGYLFALEGVVVEFLSAGIPGVSAPGDFTWSLDLNKPVGVGSFQGQGIQGFTTVDVPLGSLEIPWPLEMPEVLSPNDTIRSKVFNVNLAPGAPNYLKTILLGWRWPA